MSPQPVRKQKSGTLSAWGGAVAVVFVLALFAFLSYSYWKNAAASNARDAANAFESDFEESSALLQRELVLKTQKLDAFVAFFAGSGEVDSEEFSLFATSVMKDEGTSVVCWMAESGQEKFIHYGSDEAKRGSHCENIDFLELAKVELEPYPRISLTAFAGSKSGGQKGFLRFAFNIDTLLPKEKKANLSDYLLVSGLVENSVTVYGVAEIGLVPVLPSALAGADLRYTQLGRFDDFDFLYAAKRNKSSLSLKSVPAAVSALLLLLGLVIATYLRSQILQKKKISVEVERRTDELSQFAYRTSHDLRAPLATVMRLCKAVEEDVEDGELDDVPANVGKIADHAGRLDRLVGDIFDLTYADLADVPLEPVNLLALCNEVFQNVESSYPGKGVDMRTNIEVTSSLLLPRVRLLQILENLVSNSVKYSDSNKEGPFVEVGARMRDDKVEISISDNGVGIPKKYIGRAFKMFERFHPELSSIGSGLGMVIVKKNVENLGGEISLESSPQGTRVTVLLLSKLEKPI